MRNLKTVALVSGAVTLLMSTAPLLAQTANGLVVQTRFFNDFPGSAETVTVDGGAPMTNPAPFSLSGLPHSIDINDAGLANTGGGGFANRDDILVSTDGGATAYTGDINQGFTISATITLTDGSNSPRKETGIRVNSPVSGDALFILDSDAGEIVAFGAGALFYSFRPAIEATYVPGQSIFMQEQYVPGTPTTTGATPGTMQYWAQIINPGGANGPLLTSGPLAYSNLEGGPTTYQIGFYDQGPDGTSTPSDFINSDFQNITAVVPEPASLSLLGLGGLSLLARCRARTI